MSGDASDGSGSLFGITEREGVMSNKCVLVSGLTFDPDCFEFFLDMDYFSNWTYNLGENS